MTTKRTTRTTAYTIMGEIGNETLLEFIRNALISHEFTSHEFIYLFRTHFRNEYERMLEIYAEYGEIKYRNKQIANAIGRYLGHHRQSLYIEKIDTKRDMNINETISAASIWRKTL